MIQDDRLLSTANPNEDTTLFDKVARRVRNYFWPYRHYRVLTGLELIDLQEELWLGDDNGDEGEWPSAMCLPLEFDESTNLHGVTPEIATPINAVRVWFPWVPRWNLNALVPYAEGCRTTVTITGITLDVINNDTDVEGVTIPAGQLQAFIDAYELVLVGAYGGHWEVTSITDDVGTITALSIIGTGAADVTQIQIQQGGTTVALVPGNSDCTFNWNRCSMIAARKEPITGRLVSDHKPPSNYYARALKGWNGSSCTGGSLIAGKGAADVYDHNSGSNIGRLKDVNYVGCSIPEEGDILRVYEDGFCGWMSELICKNQCQQFCTASLDVVITGMVDNEVIIKINQKVIKIDTPLPGFDQELADWLAQEFGGVWNVDSTQPASARTIVITATDSSEKITVAKFTSDGTTFDGSLSNALCVDGCN